MATNTNSKGHLALSLSADRSLDSDIMFPERRIVLNADNKSVTIGRASKVSSKGYIAGVDNGWFDSAVMSRQHAKIVVDMDKKKVNIKDLGSLHGTYLNGGIHPVSTNEFEELADGDKLQFGVAVFRGKDGFNPATVTVGIQFCERETAGTSTFKVPDGSDDEGSDMEQSSSSSDGNFQRPNRPTPADSSRSSGNGIGVIDLTNANGGRSVNAASPNEDVARSSMPREIIDLSSPIHSPIRIDDDEDDSTSAVALDGDGPRYPIDVHVGSPPVSPELGGLVSQDGLGEDIGDSVMGDLEDLSGFDSNPRPDFASDEEDVSLSYGGNSTDTDSLGSESNSNLDYSDEEESENDFSLEGDSEMRSDWDEDLEHDEDMDLFEGEDDYSSEDDGYSIGSHLDGIHGPWDNIPPSPQPAEYPEIAMIVEALTTSAVPEPAPEPSESAARSTTAFTIEGLLNEDKPQSPAPEPVKESQDAQSSQTAVRDASPSKSFYTAPSYSFSANTTVAEALGARTGKFDFFSAREQNKMILNAQKAANSRHTSSVHALCNEGPSDYKFDSCRENAAKPLDESFGLSRISEQPRNDSAPKQQVASPPPETSSEQAASFSVAPIDTHKPDADSSARRTHVGISDIVNQQTPEPRKTAKRKADDISSTTREEELWAGDVCDLCDSDIEITRLTPDIFNQPSSFRQLSPPTSNASESEKMEPSEPRQREESVAVAVAVAVPVATAAAEVPERPSKRARMMQIAERVGYAALGGVTAGAMIVGTLIYTAPTFS